MRCCISVGVAALFACLGAAVASPLAAPAPSTSPKVRLAKGSVGGATYEVTAHRKSRAAESTQPCISISLAGAGENLGGTSCGLLASPGPMFGATIGEAKRQRTVWALAYEPMVRRVKFDLTGHEDVVVPLTLLSRHKSRKAGLRRFRYGVLAFRGQVCLVHSTTYDAQGRAVRDADEMIC